MKLKYCVILLGLLVWPPAYSAVEIIYSAEYKMSKVGVISISSFHGSPSEAVKELQRKANQAGATHFRITSFGTPGKSSYLTATAVLYKQER